MGNEITNIQITKSEMCMPIGNAMAPSAKQIASSALDGQDMNSGRTILTPLSKDQIEEKEVTDKAGNKIKVVTLYTKYKTPKGKKITAQEIAMELYREIDANNGDELKALAKLKTKYNIKQGDISDMTASALPYILDNQFKILIPTKNQYREVTNKNIIISYKIEGITSEQKETIDTGAKLEAPHQRVQSGYVPITEL